MKGKRLPVVLTVIALLLSLLSFQGLAAEIEPASQESCKYFYQLEKSGADSMEKSTFLLYVTRSDPAREPLHAGSITLAIPARFSVGESADLLKFTPSTGWVSSESECSKTPGGQAYISFSWYCASNAQPQDDPTTGRQLLGELEISVGYLDPSYHIELLPWPETAMGGSRILAWQGAVSGGGDVEAALETVRRTWRMPNLSQVTQGYYQGYYVPARTESGEAPEESMVEVDLTANWLRFTIGAYAPQREIKLELYPSGSTELAAVATSAADDGIGHFRRQVDFTLLEYHDSEGEVVSAQSLNGTYDLVVSKQSHVTCRMIGLVFQDGDCGALNGFVLELPCGDVDGNGAIGQKDRALLTLPQRYFSALSDNLFAEVYDLNGDLRVDQKDLAIMIAAANYGKMNFSLDFTSDKL